MRIFPFHGAAIVMAPLLALGVVSCSRPPPQEEPVRAVKLMTVRIGQMASEAEFAGEVRARIESRLGFRVSGKLVRRQAEVGQRVKPGDILAQLDPQDLKLATDAVKAQLELVLTNRDMAASEFHRSKTLKAQNFISGVELERRQAALDSANAQVEQVRAQLSAQTNQSGYANLVATVAGTVTAVEVEPGQVVAVGAPVVRIAQDGPLDVVFSVPEGSVAELTMGSAADVKVWSNEARLKGVVREKAALADPVTRTFQIKLALEPRARLPLGSTVTVTPKALSTKGLEVIKLPTSALKQDGTNSAVWVFDPTSKTLRSQPVQIVAADGNEVVIGSGLEPGAQVVIAGVHVLSAGQKVSVYRSPQQNNGVGVSPADPAAAPVAAASASK